MGRNKTVRDKYTETWIIQDWIVGRDYKFRDILGNKNGMEICNRGEIIKRKIIAGGGGVI